MSWFDLLSIARWERNSEGLSILKGELFLSVNLIKYLLGATWALAKKDMRMSARRKVVVFIT
jgi:hypothetical protein